MDIYEQAEDARISCEYERARNLYGECLDLGISVEESHLGLGHVLRMQGDFESSLKHYEKALDSPLDESFSSDASLGKALALRALCRHREAISILKGVRDSFETADDEEGLAYVFWALGGAHRISGEFTKAGEFYLKALAIYTSQKDDHGITYCSCGLGGLSRILGDIDASEKYYAHAQTLAKGRGDLFGISYSYCGLGNVHRMRREYSQAMALFSKAEKGYDQLGDRVSYAYTVWSMATVQKILGERDRSEEYFAKCLSYFETTHDPRGKVYTLSGQAELRGNSSLLGTCRELVESFDLSWEALLVESVSNHLEGGDSALFDERYSLFGTSWRPGEAPFNIP